MEKDIDWEKIAKLLEKEHPSTAHLNEQELEAFMEMKEVWQSSQQLRIDPNIPPERIERAKNRMWARIEQEEGEQAPTRDTDETYTLASRNKKLWPSIIFAASIALLIGVFLVAPQNTPEPSASFIAVEQGAHTLPDKTEIDLQEGRLTYQFDQERQLRKVSLEGKAYFQVSKDKEAPFVIETPTSAVEVIGTAFTLNAVVSPNAPVIEVEEGVVAFQPKVAATPMPIILRAADQLTWMGEENAWKRRNQKTQSEVVWKEQTLSFDITLQELALLFSDLQDTPVKLEGSRIAGLRVSTAGQGMPYKDPKSMLEQVVMPISHEVQLIVEEEQWTLKQQ